MQRFSLLIQLAAWFVMRWFFVLIPFAAWFAAPAGATAQQIEKKKDAQGVFSVNVGQIIIVGGDGKLDAAIRIAIGLIPGDLIDDAKRAKAEQKLKPFGATLKTVESGIVGFKDLLITVQGGKKAPPKDTAKQPPSLEQMIAEALKNNPDIRVAETKVREMEAELERTRLKVVSDLATVHAHIEAAQAAVETAHANYERNKQLHAKRVIDAATLQEASSSLAKTKAELTALQAKLPYLLGTTPGRSAGPPAPISGIAVEPPADLHGKATKYLEATFKNAPLTDEEFRRHDKLRKALDKAMHMDAKGFTPKEVMELLRGQGLPGINLLVRAKKMKNDALNVNFTAPVPVGAFLQYLEDELDIMFVLREYGIVVVDAGERLPPGAVRVVDFWKQRAKTDPFVDLDPNTPSTEPKAKPKVVPPPVKPGEPRGKIDKVDQKDPLLVQLSIGADAGVQKGDLLHIYRLQPQPRYLGSLRIERVLATGSIGRVLTTFTDGRAMPRAGDQVAAQLTQK